MDQPTNSFKQFHYGLRPSKQVERKIIIEVLHRLGRASFDVSEYTYLGFGSVYFVDFIMFHKYLFMQKMVCVEWGEIPKRMKFNKPFKFIELKMMKMSEYISRIKAKAKYLVWLDYDYALDPQNLGDIDGFITALAPESIFLITLDARPKLPKEEKYDTSEMTKEKRLEFTLDIYNEWFRKYLGRDVTLDDIDARDCAPLFYEATIERIKQSLATRPGLEFIQLFHFLYADGAPMLTIGGMLGTPADRERLERKNILSHPFARTDEKYLEISLPPLTVREKHWLDSRLDKNLHLDKLAFELDEEDLLDNYRAFYKEYPTYAEAML